MGNTERYPYLSSHQGDGRTRFRYIERMRNTPLDGEFLPPPITIINNSNGIVGIGVHNDFINLRHLKKIVNLQSHEIGVPKWAQVLILYAL
jgi:hypothetical protein